MEEKTNVVNDGVVVESVEKVLIIPDPDAAAVITTAKVTCNDCLVEIFNERRQHMEIRHKSWGINIENGLVLKSDLVCKICGKNAILKYR